MTGSLSTLVDLDLRLLPDGVLAEMLDALKEETRRRAKFGPSAKSSDRKLRWGRALGWKKVAQQPYDKCQHGMFDDLLSEDWSDIYPRVDGERKFYVYAHIRPSERKTERFFRRSKILPVALPGLPFYVGKGCGDRAWDLGRNEGHGVELRALAKAGAQPAQIVHLIKDGLTEQEALEIEAKLILFFGTRFGTKRRGLLVNLDIPKMPEHLR